VRMMKEVSCYLCGADSRTTLFKQRGRDPYFEIVFGPDRSANLYWHVCNRCGFVYRSPTLDEQELARLYAHYEQDVFKDRDPDAYFDRIVGLTDTESEHAQKTRGLGDVLRAHGGGRSIASMSVLDVGCGGGTLLYAMREKLGFDRLCAVEPNTAYAEQAAKRLGADVRNQGYEPGLFGRRFDLVVCTKVLEHVAHPGPFVSALARDTAEDGFVFVEVPDVSDVYSLPPSHDRFYIPHIYFFSANTMAVLMGKAGLETVASRTIVTGRGRSYLQLVSRRGGRSPLPARPYDDPKWLAQQVVRLQPEMSETDND
jgi:2-polyprenyl-3-methyl-5-hydroxy-6-metoxy-1,4-benzoquinol methylase